MPTGLLTLRVTDTLDEPVLGRLHIELDQTSESTDGFEVLRNKFKGRTNPYLVRELLLLADFEGRPLNPGYRFVFKNM
jgi:hypothetical protein